MPGKFRSLRSAACLTMLAAVLTLAACSRNAPPITACNGDLPAVERIKDVAPPNCPNG